MAGCRCRSGETLQLRRQLRQAREVPAPEPDAPALLHDGLLQALDEAISPRKPALGARVPDAQLAAGALVSPRRRRELLVRLWLAILDPGVHDLHEA